MISLLVCLAVLVHFAPEHLAVALHQSQAAWEFVAYGAEAALLWLMVGMVAPTLPARFVALWAFLESAQRPVCRLALPMDRAPHLAEGQTLCDAALGINTAWLSVPAALFVVAIVQEATNARGR